MASQVQLANTFNEFREAYNTAANDITVLQGLTGGTGAANVTGLTINTFTNIGRVPVVGANGTLVVDSGFSYDTSTTNLTVNGQLSSAAIVSTANGNFAGSLTAANVTANNLTSGRILIAGTSGRITDDSGLTYNAGTDALTASGAVAVNSLSATTWANAANMSVSANVNVVDTVNALGHLHAGGVEAWITAKGEDRDIHLIAAVDDNDGPHDIAIVNRNNNANAYGEFIAMNNSGNTDQGWVSMGINATNYNQGAFAITKGDDAYLLYQAPQGTTQSGDLVIGTGGNGTGNKIIFSANGFDDPANNTQLTIEPGVRVHVEVPTQSVSTTTGALTIAGGLGVVGNMNVGGNVTITGSITLLGAGNTVSTDTLSVANAMLFLANGNAADSIDLGVIGEYTTGTKKYTGIVRDASDGVVKFFQDASTKPANTVNFAEAGLNYSNVRVGVLHSSNTTSTAGPGSGALIVTGGAGIGGGVWAGGAIRTDDTTASTSTSTGALIINGGAGIAGNTHVGGTLNVTGVTTLSANASVTGLTGNFTAYGNPTFAGTTTFSGTTEFTGPVRMQDVVEDVVDVAPSTNQYTLDFTSGNIFYASSAPAADFQVLATNVPTTNGRISTLSFILPQGATGRRPVANTISINGTNTLINWVGGNTGFTPTNSKTDIFNFTILRRGSAFTVAGTVSANTVL